MIDLARGVNGGFLGASGLIEAVVDEMPARPARASRLPSAMLPTLRPVRQKNCRRVSARVVQCLGLRFMVHRPIKIAETVLFWQLLFRHLGLRWGARQFSSKDEIPSKSRLEYLATEI